VLVAGGRQLQIAPQAMVLWSERCQMSANTNTYQTVLTGPTFEYAAAALFLQLSAATLSAPAHEYQPST
jgi:hypothetical protein